MTIPFEHGSELHWLSYSPRSARNSHPWNKSTRLYGSGRDALRGLVEYGQNKRGWQRLWLPSFLCQEVVGAIAEQGVAVCLYPDRPTSDWCPPSELCAGDVVMVVNTFGLRDTSRWHPPEGVELIEDHTHDPWSPWAQESSADYCVASLRKTLPIADGGVLWSPSQQGLPDPIAVSSERALAAADKSASMLLKAMYLGGHAVDKEKFRRLATAGERDIASGEISGMSSLTMALLDTFPTAEWRRRRLANWQSMDALVSTAAGCTVLQPESERACPFSLVVVSDSAERRNSLKASLVAEGIYPAVLWPLEETHFQLADVDLDLSRRVLSVHCDMRYDRTHVEHVAQRIVSLNEACGS